MRPESRFLQALTSLALVGFILTSCATQPIAGPTGLPGEQRPCGGAALDCRGYFSQAQRDFKMSLSGLYGPIGGGVGFGAGSSQLIALDSISGDMILHYQRYCQQYNACLISREEFLRRTDTLQTTQTEVRRLVGTLPTPQVAPSPQSSSLPEIVYPPTGVTYPEGMTKEMRVADAVFKVVLEAMRPPGATGSVSVSSGPSVQQFPSTPAPPVVTAPAPPPVPYSLPQSAPTVSPGAEDPFRAIANELTQIARSLGTGQVPMKAVLGEISYRNTEFGSPLSVFMKGQLQEQLSRSGAFVLVEAPRLRTISVAQSPKSSTALAEASGADLVIIGNYWDTPEGVELFVSVRQRQGDVLLGVARAFLPTAALPRNTPVAPPNLESARLNERIEDRIAPLSGLQTANPLKVEVWTDRGKGAIYSDGEDVLILVRVNQDAYLRLYYTDANNQTYQVFPNLYRQEGRISGGKVVALPAQEDRFVFRVKSPFGVESITALVSRKPFGGPGGLGASSGPFLEVPQGIRGLEVVASSAGEGEVVRDRAVLTTVRRAP